MEIGKNIQRYDVTSDMAILRDDGHWVKYEDHAAALAAERAKLEKFAAFVGPDGEPRKVVGNIPILASGEFVGPGADVWGPSPIEGFGRIIHYDFIPALEVSDGDRFRAYPHQCYSTKQAAEAAKEKK